MLTFLFNSFAGVGENSSNRIVIHAANPQPILRNAFGVALLLLMGFLTPALAQQPAVDAKTQETDSPDTTRQVFRVTSKIVLVDVSVTDNAGRPVSGLKVTDFTVLEKNQPQRIRSFDEHVRPPAGTEPTKLKLPPLGQDVFTNYTPVPPNGTLTVVLLDMLNTPFREQSIVRDQLIKFLDSMHAEDRVAIFGLSSRLLLLQGFTSDPSILKKALKSAKAGQLSRLLDDPATGAQSDTGAEANPDQYGSDPNTMAVLQNLQQFEQQSAAIQQQVRTQYTLDALNLLARYLSGMTGRKNILWFSSSFPTATLLDDTTGGIALAPDLQREIRETTNLLAATQASIYPVDAEGLFVNPTFNASVSHGSKSPALAQNIANSFQRTATGHGSMDQLAEDTGGRAFYNTNGLAEAAAAAIDVGANFYTLAYTPSDKSQDGNFRRISVKLSEKGYHLSFRSGYYADKPTAAQPEEDAVPKAGSIAASLMRGAPNPTEIIFKVRAQPSATDISTVVAGNDSDPKIKGPYRTYTIDYSADIHNVSVQPLADNLHHMSLEFVAILYDQNNAMINSVSNAVGGDLTAQSYAETLRSGLKMRQQISIPTAKGQYTLRVCIHDTLSNRLGTVEIPVAELTPLPSEPASTPAKP